MVCFGRMATTLSNVAPAASGAGTQNISDVIASLGPSGGQNITGAITGLAAQITQLNSANEQQRQAIADNTNALIQQAGQTGQSVASKAGDFGKSLLKDTLGALPLAGLISGLFSSSTPTPPPLVRYSQALPINVSQVSQGGQTGPANYDQYGNARMPGLNSFLGSDAVNALAQPQNGSGGSSNAQTGVPAASGANAQASSSPAQTMNITLNVNALDSRSILDRSDDIASAVRQAMLNTHSMNDVINDL